jgi:ABC-2 type transport system ATP-binding protein
MHTRPIPSRPEADAPDVVIRARNLTRHYIFHTQAPGLLAGLRSVLHRESQTRVAVDGVDLTVRRGEVVGLLGPNGAGKTSTLKMLTGLLHPTSGELKVLGFTPFERKVEYLRRIALVMANKSHLWWDVSAIETILLHKELYAIPDDIFRVRLDAMAEMLDVENLLGVQVRKLSLGERMKCELIAALIHDPDIIYLDEPTIGLDVVAKARVREFLAQLNRESGTTILITSHDMDDIEALCPRVVLIDHGRVGYDGRLDTLVREVQPRKLVKATFAGPVESAGLLAAHPTATVYPSDATDLLDLAVEREELSDVLATLARIGRLVDVDVTDAEVEAIIKEVFQRRDHKEVAS